MALRLIACLERFLGKASSMTANSTKSMRPRKLTVVEDGQNDLLIVSTLDLLHGILLIHPPSRSLFAREIYMNVRGLPP